MAKVLVTGSCGFLAHHLVKKLRTQGHYIIGVDNLSNGDEKYSSLSDIFVKANVGDLQEEDLKGVDYVFHTAALPRVPFSIEYPLETHDSNVNQTLSLLIAARDAGVKKVVYSSSSSVYGGQDHYPSNEEDRTIPMSPYAVQKLAAELYCEVFRTVYGLPTASLRYFNIYGEEQRADNPYTGVLTIFRKLAEEGKVATIHGDGEQRRDFTYVGDVVDANILAAEKGLGVYNVGMGKNYSINEVARAIGGPMEHGEKRKGDPLVSLADNKKLLGLGWQPKMDLMTWLKN